MDPLNTTKKVNRKSSKPILNWLQRKLGGPHRTVRRSEPSSLATKQSSSPAKPQRIPDINQQPSPRPSSTSALSSWRNSATVEADEDASIRPIPPTSPPSPMPSRSSSSFVSDPRTFMSTGATSTKATTLLSIDMAPNGMAHIAQAPSTPNSVHNYVPTPSPIYPRIPSPRTSGSISSLNPNGTTAITFSTLPPTTASNLTSTSSRLSAMQAPLHTQHHPRNNPRPSSPPLDNASILTLASSAYATPGPRFGPWGGDSQSQIVADDISHAPLDELQLEERDMDASVRALRPRSSRRGSWDSEVSGWSTNSPIAQDKSQRTAPSVRSHGWIATGESGENDREEAEQEHVENCAKDAQSEKSETTDTEEHRTPAGRALDLT